MGSLERSLKIVEQPNPRKTYGVQRALCALVVMLLLACTVSEVFCAEKGEPSGKSPSIKITGSGASPDDPIVIRGASNGQEGVRVEYTTLAQRFPKCSQVSQRMIRHKDRPMDVIRIRLANGTERDVFFDISDFFGKSAPAAHASAECTVSEATSIFKDKSFLQYLADLPQGKDISAELQQMAREGKVKTIPKGVKVQSLRTQKVGTADVVEIRIPNNANAPGTWWILKTDVTCGR